MKRRDLIRILEQAGFVQMPSGHASNHDKYRKGKVTVRVKRHREIEDEIAKRILREAGLR